MAKSKYPYKLDPKNIRLHTEANNAMIDQSLDEVGAFRSIGVDGDGIIRAGNGVYERAKAKGLKLKVVEIKPDELLVAVRPDLRGEKAERAAYYDNRAGELSIWNTTLMAKIAGERPQALKGIFDPKQVAQYARLSEIAEPRVGIPAPNTDPDVNEGEPKEKESGYVAVLGLTDDQYNDPNLKREIAEFCKSRGIPYRIQKHPVA